MNVQHGSGVSDGDIDFSRLVRAIFEARYWIGAIVLLTALSTFVVVHLISSKYRAETKILIQSQESAFTDKDRGQEEDRALLDQQGILSQVQLLESSDLARTIIQRFNLEKVDEFNPIGELILSEVLAAIGLAEPNSVEDEVLLRYFDRLEVFQVERSRVIVVRFWSEDPELSARIANGIVEEYFTRQVLAKRELAGDAVTNLTPEIADLKTEVEKAQRRVAEFRAGADLLLGADNQTLGQQQLAELNSQLSAARAAKADAEAKASLIRELLRSGSALESATDVLSSQLIQRLRERQVALKARIAELSTTMLPNHPEIKGLRSQLADLDSQIGSEARKIVRGFESEATLAEARMQSLADGLNELKAQAAQANSDEIRLRELEREAEIKTSRLERRMGLLRDAQARQTAEVLPVDADPFSWATPPAKSFSPRRTAITIGATLASLLLCIGVVVMREFLTGDAFVERQMAEGVPEAPYEAELDPVWEEVRKAGRFERGQEEPVDPSARRDNVAQFASAPVPEDPLQDAINHLIRPFAECHDWLEDNGLRCVIVASREYPDLAAETALELARQTSDAGGSTIMIMLQGELDNVDQAESAYEIEGLSELMSGEASFADVIFQDLSSRAHLIAQGTRPMSLDEVDTEQFGFLIDALEQTYDRVIVAIGPLGSDLATVDLLRLGDSVVLSVTPESDDRWGLAAFETLATNGFADIFVTEEPYGRKSSAAA